MQLCYIDESGDTGSFTLDNVNSQPVFLLTALFMPQERLADVTRSVIALKQRYFPKMKPAGDHWHDWLRVEVKGAEFRRLGNQGATASNSAKVDSSSNMLVRRTVTIKQVSPVTW